MSAFKITGAVAIGLTFFVLSQVGYVAGEHAVNTPEAVRHLEIVYLAGPIFFVTLGAACLIGYHLDDATHSDIRRQLDHRDALYSEAAVLEGMNAEHADPVQPGSDETFGR